MSKHRENWMDYEPPTVPIYFISYEALEVMLERNPRSVSDVGLEMMLGYCEEYEKYEMAALVKKAQDKNKLNKPPDNNEGWVQNDQYWSRPLTDEETKRFLDNDEGEGEGEAEEV